MSEVKIRISLESVIPQAMRKSFLILIHHSTSPLDELVDKISTLCHSQFFLDEEVLFAQSPL